MRRHRALVLLPYPTQRTPGQRFRIEQWAPRLREDGIDLEYSCFLRPETMDVLYRPGHFVAKTLALVRGYLRRLGDLRRLGRYDAVVVHRWATFYGPPWVESRAGRRLPLVYDFDDAIFVRQASRANAWTAAFKPRSKTAAICRTARHVIVGNEYLASYARQHAPAVTVIPTTIDTDAYVPVERTPNPVPVVGWSGSVTTVPHLETIATALARVAQGADFELSVLGGQPRLAGCRMTAAPWSEASELPTLRRFDIGLMPVPDDEWARGKCGLKALQYMALGIPPVVSPVGVNAEIVEDGVNGFHARTESEWVDRLLRLISDADLRKRLGTAARQSVERRYSAKVQAPVFGRVLRQAMGHTLEEPPSTR